MKKLPEVKLRNPVIYRLDERGMFFETDTEPLQRIERDRVRGRASWEKTKPTAPPRMMKASGTKGGGTERFSLTPSASTDRESGDSEWVCTICGRTNTEGHIDCLGCSFEHGRAEPSKRDLELIPLDATREIEKTKEQAEECRRAFQLHMARLKQQKADALEKVVWGSRPTIPKRAPPPCVTKAASSRNANPPTDATGGTPDGGIEPVKGVRVRANALGCGMSRYGSTRLHVFRIGAYKPILAQVRSNYYYSGLGSRGF